MVDVRIKDLPLESSPVSTEFVAIDGTTTRRATVASVVAAGRPLASQAEAEAGTDAAKTMTPLTTKQAIDAIGLSKSGNLAGLTNPPTARSNLGLAIGSNVQAYDDNLATIVGLAKTDGNFIVSDGMNWTVESGATARTSLGLGTAATSNTGDFATAAQGGLADTAVQPATLTAGLATKQPVDASLTTLSGKTIGTKGLDVLAGAAASDVINTLGGAAGQFVNAQLADLDAAKLTGTIDPARIPILPSAKQVVSSGGIADLTAPQQTEIGQGTIVTTTDGRRWVYTGTGSKVLEASYIQLADITPEWDQIANKPALATGAQGALADSAVQPGAAVSVLAETTTAKIMSGAERTKLGDLPDNAALAASLATKFNNSGGTITGGLTVAPVSGAAQVIAMAPTLTTNPNLALGHAGVKTWEWQGYDGQMYLNQYNKTTGMYITYRLNVNESGVFSFSQRPTVGGVGVALQSELGTSGYKGAWNATTNSPTITAGVGTTGDYYITSVAGTQSITGSSELFSIGDQARFNGTAWERIPNFSAVTSVAGRTGAITLSTSDISGLGTAALAAAGDFATSAAFPGLSTSVQGTGISGLDGGHWMIWNSQTGATFDNDANLRLDRNMSPSVVAGVSGNTYATLQINGTAGANNQGYEWPLTVVLYNYSKVSLGSQNVAINSHAHVMDNGVEGTGATWASNFTVIDHTGVVNPTAGRIGCELNTYAKNTGGTDTSRNRVGLQIAVGVDDAGATISSPLHIGRGFLIGGNHAQVVIDRIFEVGGLGTYEIGFDSTGATFTKPVYMMAQDQRIAFDGNTSGVYNRSLFYSGGSLAYQTASGVVLTVSDTGLVIANGGITLGNAAKLANVTVASLPSASSGIKGAMYAVTDAASDTFNAVLSGGGSNCVIAYCDGTNWRVH